MTADQSFQQKIVGSASSVLSAIYQHPYLTKGFGVDQRLMSTFHHDPIFSLLMQTLLGLVANLYLPPLHHVADVGLVLQHIRDSLAAPQTRIGAFSSHIPAAVGSWRWNAFFIQSCRDLAAAHTVQCHSKDPPHHGRRFLVNDDLVFLIGVHLVAIDGLAADKLSLALLIPLDALDLLGDVLGVHIVHDGPERRDVVGAGLHAGVDAVQKRNVAHPMLRKVPLHIVAGHDVVTPQTAQVLGNDHVDLPGLNIADHSLKIRAVKVGTAPAIVNVGVINLQTVFLHKFI